jgi:hypothetical protein
MVHDQDLLPEATVMNMVIQGMEENAENLETYVTEN